MEKTELVNSKPSKEKKKQFCQIVMKALREYWEKVRIKNVQRLGIIICNKNVLTRLLFYMVWGRGEKD